MKVIVMISSVALIFSLPIVLLLTSVELNTFNLDFYENKYEQYGIMDKTKINKSELLYITKQLLDYLRNRRDDINIYAKVGLQVKQVFGEKEKLHMEDVKNLFQKGFLLRNTLLIISLLSLFFLLRFAKDKLKKVLTITLVYPIVIIILLLILLNIDFNKYFTYFHLIFFNNDLWVLNPKTDIIIQMLPLEFFYSIALRIIICFSISLLLIFLFSRLIIKKGYKLL